jgi:ribosomal protein S27AE
MEEQQTNERKKMIALMNKLKTNVRATCLRCGETTVIRANVSDLVAWQKGKLIQDVLSYLSDNERELLISKTCGKCYDEFFEENDEDED